LFRPAAYGTGGTGTGGGRLHFAHGRPHGLLQLPRSGNRGPPGHRGGGGAAGRMRQRAARHALGVPLAGSGGSRRRGAAAGQGAGGPAAAAGRAAAGPAPLRTPRGDRGPSRRRPARLPRMGGRGHPRLTRSGKPCMTPNRPLPARRLPGLLLVLLAWLAPFAGAHAAIDESELLPVDQAFVLTATAPEPGRIEVHWKIAEGVYLSRHRTSVSASGGFIGGNLRLPAGERHVDEFFGPVETYCGSLVAILDGQPTGTTATADLQIRYQGCADAGICYPPQTRQVQVRLPAAGQAGTRQSGSPGRGRLAAALAGVGGALPESQAFAVDAVADGGNRLRVRLQPVEGYYIYRDMTRFALEDAPGLSTGRPRWPAGTAHRDELFGDVTVYFEPTEVAVPVPRTRPEAATATPVVTFQGSQGGANCYPPLTRRVPVHLAAGNVLPQPAALSAAPADAGTDAPTGAGGEAAADGMDAAEPAPDASAGNAGRTRAAAATARVGGTLAGALLLALVGGLVLNLMPCVLPVLSLKALGLVQSGESRERARAHALWYTAGVLVAFAAVGALVVALRAAGQAAGWGFQ